MPAASALAQSGGDEIFTAAATSLVEVGSADLSWFAADVDIAEGDPVQDPAAGAAGFLLVDRGGLMVAAAGGRRTLLDAGDALFFAADDQLRLQGVGDDATVWRIAVVTDGDGLTTDEEAALGTGPDLSDTDNDGHTDLDEANAGTDPLVADTDGGGVSDGNEVLAGTSPTDGGGDGAEANQIGTLPTAFATDNDTLSDGEEINPPAGKFPTRPLSADTDGDGARDNADTFPSDPARTQ